jgi:hypothetical protein
MPDAPKPTADILAFPRKPEPERDQSPQLLMFGEPDEETKARHIRIMREAFDARSSSRDEDGPNAA